MRRLIIDVKHKQGGWVAEWRGFGRTSQPFSRKTLAVEFAVSQALLHHDLGGIAQVVIFLKARPGQRSTIQEERTFGNDPRESVG